MMRQGRVPVPSGPHFACEPGMQENPGRSAGYARFSAPILATIPTLSSGRRIRIARNTQSVHAR